QVRFVKRWLTRLGLTITIFGPPISFWVYSELAVPGAVLLYGLVIVAIGHFEDVTEFAFASLRVKMEGRISQADQLLAQLREIGSEITAAHLETLINSHFLAGTPFGRKVAQHRQLMSALEKAGVPENRRRIVEQRWRWGVEKVIAVAMRSAANEALGDHADNRVKLNAEFDKLLKQRDGVIASPAEFRSVLQESGALTAATTSWLDELEHYQAGGEFRREKEFQ
ncbi:MAG TPA: hypothetical protein VL754_02170, partial [Verrucomicrobiae bacterium]|nr:hypothetical protein [Verrucomicrobiae bacterium]